MLDRLPLHCARANLCTGPMQVGLFLRAIGPCNRVGDVEHGSCRIANAIVKRVNETLKDLIENGEPDVARAARDAGKALVLELHKLLDEVKNVPHAERLAPRPTMYLRLTWKCEVGAQLGLKRLIWG